MSALCRLPLCNQLTDLTLFMQAKIKVLYAGQYNFLDQYGVSDHAAASCEPGWRCCQALSIMNKLWTGVWLSAALLCDCHDHDVMSLITLLVFIACMLLSHTMLANCCPCKPGHAELEVGCSCEAAHTWDIDHSV